MRTEQELRQDLIDLRLDMFKHEREYIQNEIRFVENVVSILDNWVKDIGTSEDIEKYRKDKLKEHKRLLKQLDVLYGQELAFRNDLRADSRD